MFPISHQSAYTKKHGNLKQTSASAQSRTLLSYLYKLTSYETAIEYAAELISQNEIWADQKIFLIKQLQSLQKTLIYIEKTIKPFNNQLSNKGKFKLTANILFYWEQIETLINTLTSLPEKDLKIPLTRKAKDIQHQIQNISTGHSDLIQQLDQYLAEAL